MDLPVISLPLQVPDTLPLLLHPAAVHFAVVLPLVILIVELINLITKRKSLTVSVYLLFGLLIVALVAAYMTGVTDGREAGPLLSDEGLTALKSHKLVGIYLIYLALLPMILKGVSIVLKKPWARVLYILSFAGVLTLTVYQAKEGGELVFTYGANVASQQALEEKIESLEEETVTLKEAYEAKLTAYETALGDCNLSSAEANASFSLDLNGTTVPSVGLEVSNLSMPQDTNNSTAAKPLLPSDANRSK